MDTPNVSDLLSNRRRQWAKLTPQQQMQRVHYALLDFQDHAIRLRQALGGAPPRLLAQQPEKVKDARI